MSTTPHETNRQDADGTAYISFYDNEHALSFIWDGRSRYVQVCEGGAGEPVVAKFEVDLGYVGSSIGHMLAKFQRACERYVNSAERVLEQHLARTERAEVPYDPHGGHKHRFYEEN